MLKTEGVLHFTIPVKDLDRSEKFYTEILGMEKIRRTGHMVFLRAAGKDNFVLTYSEKPIDPNPAGKHEIHSAFRLSAEEYDRAKAFLKAKEMGLKTIGLSGNTGGEMSKIGLDHCLIVETDSIHRIQECHVAIYHILWDLVHTLLADDRGHLQVRAAE